VIAHAGKVVEKEEHSTIAGRIANWYNHSEKTIRLFLRKLEIVLPEDPAIYYSWAYTYNMIHHITGLAFKMCFQRVKFRSS
jgi:hypothetical protein